MQVLHAMLTLIHEQFKFVLLSQMLLHRKIAK